MKIFKVFLFAILVGSFTLSCFEDQDDNVILASEINDFVWKGMNAVYLYKDEIPNLANDRFSTNEEYGNYLNSYFTPDDLFESLIYERQVTDRFSVIVDDYIALEQFFNGITVSHGMEFGLFRFSSTDTDLYGYVRYVLPNTDAEAKGIKRGDLFYGVDGTQLTVDNWRVLLGPNMYNINIGVYNNNGTPEISDDTVDPTTQTVSLTKSPYTENPIFYHSVLNVAGNRVGYLMYNGFTGTNQFDSQLNNVFGEFKTEGITDLVLDLRYNGGGSVRTATWLASMITGNYTGDVFISEEWNSEIQQEFLDYDPSLLLNPFVDEMIKTNSNGDIVFQETINHLNLTRIYVITTGSTASASELIINGLDPYIVVIQVGTTTLGKYQASTTLYDSPNFTRENVNPNHTYALQPLIFKSLNSVGFTDYDNGFIPEILLGENFANLGILGDPTEPLLAAALANIQGTGRFQNNFDDNAVLEYNDFKVFFSLKNTMYK